MTAIPNYQLLPNDKTTWADCIELYCRQKVIDQKNICAPRIQKVAYTPVQIVFLKITPCEYFLNRFTPVWGPITRMNDHMHALNKQVLIVAYHISIQIYNPSVMWVTSVIVLFFPSDIYINVFNLYFEVCTLNSWPLAMSTHLQAWYASKS